MGTTSPVDALALDLNALREHLLVTGNPSFAAALEQTAPKVLLLAAASYFEHRITAIIQDFVDSVGGSPAISSLVQRKALDRQYYKLFNWGSRKLGGFCGIFGDACGRYLRTATNEEPLASSIAIFLELGDLRNQLVHRNYAEFVLEKTTAEVMEMYHAALSFVDALPQLLRDADNKAVAAQ